ncbi:MAG: hydrogenase large subunit, partial [Thermoplasmata archaeon]
MAPLDRSAEQQLLVGLHAGPVLWEPTEELWGLTVEPAAWKWSCSGASDGLGHPLATLFGETVQDPKRGLRVHALFLGRGASAGVHLQVLLDPHRPTLTSLVDRIPYVSPFEREVAETFGVAFDGARDRRPLLLHGWPRPPADDPGTPPPELLPRECPSYPFTPVEGEGVHEVAVGPVHAGIIEPGHFRFQVVGERILRLEVRLGYTHKGTERLMEGQAAHRGTIWAESVSGDMSLAGAMAYAQAIERAWELQVPPSEENDRGLLLELERVAFLLGDVAGISLDVGYAVGAARANELRERAYRLLASLTGSRLGRATIGVGGLRRPLLPVPIDGVASTLKGIGEDIRILSEELLAKSSVLDRLEGTGTIPRWVAELVPCVGPTARASGLRVDVRHDRPYGPYRTQEVRVPRGLEGDVKARFVVKVEEIGEACRLAGRFLHETEKGAPTAPRAASIPPPGPRSGLGWVESPRGEMLVYAHLDAQGHIVRVHFRDPSFLTWPVL